MESLAAPASDPQTVHGRWSIAATALAVDDHGSAWYLRTEDGQGFVGRIQRDSSAETEVQVGPLPVALTVGPDGVYVVEGIPDGAKIGDARVGVIERLDSLTLQLLATGPISGVGTAVGLAGPNVWVAGVRGSLMAFDALTLDVRQSIAVGGRGPASMSSAISSLDIVNGVTDPKPEFLVHRIDPQNPRAPTPIEVPGSGSEALIAVGADVWVATPLDAARGALYRISGTSLQETPVRVPRIAALAAMSGRVRWITTSGELGGLAEASELLSSPRKVGMSGIAIALTGDEIWVASDDIALFVEAT